MLKKNIELDLSTSDNLGTIKAIRGSQPYFIFIYFPKTYFFIQDLPFVEIIVSFIYNSLYFLSTALLNYQEDVSLKV